jgi:hypothetical protein
VGYQEVTNSAGYRFEVPADWEKLAPPSNSKPGSVLMGAQSDGYLLSAALLVNQDFGNAPAILLATGLLSVLRRDATNFAVIAQPEAIFIPGASSGASAIISQTDRLNVLRTVYHRIGVRGNAYFVLIVDVTPAYARDHGDIVRRVLSSFELR